MLKSKDGNKVIKDHWGSTIHWYCYTYSFDFCYEVD